MRGAALCLPLLPLLISSPCQHALDVLHSCTYAPYSGSAGGRLQARAVLLRPGKLVCGRREAETLNLGPDVM
jgi:hypothetical protein